MEFRLRAAVGLGLFLAVASGSLALAQPRRGGGRTAPRAVEDAGPKVEDSGSPAASADGAARPSRSAPTGTRARSPRRSRRRRRVPATGCRDGGAAPVDYDKLIGDVAALRARAATLSDGLFRSRVAIDDRDRRRPDEARAPARCRSTTASSTPRPPAFARRTTRRVRALDRAGQARDHGRRRARTTRRTSRSETSQRSRFTVDVPKDQQRSPSRCGSATTRRWARIFLAITAGNTISASA